MSNFAEDFFDSQCEMANEAVSSTEWSKIKPRSKEESQNDGSESLKNGGKSNQRPKDETDPLSTKKPVKELKPKPLKNEKPCVSSSEEEAFLAQFKDAIASNELEIDWDSALKVRLDSVIVNDLRSLNLKGGISKIINTIAIVFLQRYGKMLKKETRIKETYIK